MMLATIYGMNLIFGSIVLIKSFVDVYRNLNFVPSLLFVMLMLVVDTLDLRGQLVRYLTAVSIGPQFSKMLMLIVRHVIVVNELVT